MERRLVFTGESQVSLESFTPAEPTPVDVTVRVHCSLISNGTESIVLHRRFDPGTSWDRWITYPFYPGYAAVGEVTAIGEEVTSVAVGDRVALRVPHASVFVGHGDLCHPIPDSLNDEQAVWFALAKITSMGARAADYSLGGSVLVIGAGPIGQMTLRWAAACGVRHLVVVDMSADRLELAKAGGATCTIDKPIGDALPEVEAACGGKAPGIVVDTTGNAAVFESALAAAASFGKVVIMGDTGSPANQNLSSDVLRKGLTIVGAHDNHVTAEWTSQVIVDLFYHLLTTGAISVDGLITHRFAPDACEEAYKIAANPGHADQGAALGVRFNWTT